MERRFQIRLDEARGDAVVPASLFRSVIDRLNHFVEPYLASFGTEGQRTTTKQYVQGLLSNLESKDIESIAYLHDADRQGLQKFVGQAGWDHRPLVTQLVRHVGTDLCEADAVLVFDPSSFPKKGTESVGVQRQWCGRLGKIENCQVGIYLGYVSKREHALVDFRLYLPKQWANRRKRRQSAGVPEEIRFSSRHELMLEMLDKDGPSLPHAWISGDDELGRCSWFRQELQARKEAYLLAVPSNTLVRDLTAPDPPYGGRGPRPQVPFIRVDRWCSELPESAWQTIDVRDGEKGPVVVKAVRTLVQARTEGKPSEVAETLVVFRERQADGSWKHDYLLSNGKLATPLVEFARVFKAQHRIEECLQRAKGEAGLADYQVRTWRGWHHHQTLSLIATWFLTKETKQKKNHNPCADGSASAKDDRGTHQQTVEVPSLRTNAPHHEPPIKAKRGGSRVSLESPQAIGA